MDFRCFHVAKIVKNNEKLTNIFYKPTDNAKIVSRRTVILESGCFQQVHVLYCLAYCTFQQVVNGRGNQYLTFKAVDMYHGLIGVHHLFQVDGLVAIVGEGCILIEFLVSSDDVFGRSLGLDHGCAEDATGKVTTIGNKVDGGIQITLHLSQTLANLGNVLMLKCFIDTQIVVAP